MKGTKLSIGDKVRFRTDGDIGILNQSMGFNLYVDYTVTGLSCRGEHNLYDLSCGKHLRLLFIPEVQLEPATDPKHKFADIKVGDWVEIEYDNGCKYHCQVIQSGCSIVVSFDGSEMYFDINGNELCKEENDNSFTIIRIISPKEVVIDFGSGIKGTVSKTRINADGSERYFYIKLQHSGEEVTMPLDALDPQTRAKVEKLLKAQEETK